MRALVIHESLYGNTRRVAHEVAAGLAARRPDVEIHCLSAARVAREPGVLAGADLLVLGCPTHAWNMSSTRSRSAQLAKDAAEEPGRRHDEDAAGPGLHEVLAVLPGEGARVAAFDTRMPTRFSGNAAKHIARRARAAGAVVVGRPTGFVVAGFHGPLVAGEVERARAWGAELAALLPVTDATCLPSP
jgi:hypothetical protein